MSKQEIVKGFGDRRIRSVGDDQAEEWYFSVIDVVAASGGSVARNARLEIEQKTGRKVISPLNASDAGALDVDIDGALPPPEK